MATAPQTIFDERSDWKRDIAWSLGLHAALAIAIIGVSISRLSNKGSNWGGAKVGETTVNATLVSAAPVIPLPTPPQPTENIVANESKGISETQPKTPPPPEPKAIDIPDKTTKVKPAPPRTTPEVKKPPVEAPKDNTVPYGAGGPVKQNMAIVNSAIGAGAIAVNGSGDFGARYAWYVDAVRRKVSENWYQYQVDPHSAEGRRVYVGFDINRNGSPGNVHVVQPSGVPSLDYSAVNALKRIDTFGPLPSDYRGGYVSVEFYFDYKK